MFLIMEVEPYFRFVGSEHAHKKARGLILGLLFLSCYQVTLEGNLHAPETF